MLELAAQTDIGTVAALVAVSFFSFVAGTIFRKWPDKVQEYAESIDGFVLFISPQTHRAIIDFCGVALVAMSFAALLAATFIA
jgi:hypothetical protein